MVQITFSVVLILATAAIAPTLALPVPLQTYNDLYPRWVYFHFYMAWLMINSFRSYSSFAKILSSGSNFNGKGKQRAIQPPTRSPTPEWVNAQLSSLTLSLALARVYIDLILLSESEASQLCQLTMSQRFLELRECILSFQLLYGINSFWSYEVVLRGKTSKVVGE